MLIQQLVQGLKPVKKMTAIFSLNCYLNLSRRTKEETIEGTPYSAGLSSYNWISIFIPHQSLF